MKVGEFVSDQYAGLYPVVNDPLALEFIELKAFMIRCITVQEWNAMREIAKAKYPPQLINRLDASGFIKSLNLKNEKDENN